MSRTSPRPLSPRRKTGGFALLLAAVLNVLLPLVSVFPALAEVGDIEATLLSDTAVICTPQGIRPLETPTKPSAPALDGHCEFCFASQAFAILPPIATVDNQLPPLRETIFGFYGNQIFIANAHVTPGDPRAPPLFL